MGERTPPKTNGFWISFRPNVTTVQKGPQRIASASTLAAAGVVGREHLRFYRFEQLSNRALAAVRVREVKITGSVKRFRCTERMEKFPLWNVGAAAGMGGRRFRVLPPAVPFLPAAEEMGERTPPKTNGFWISFRPNVTTVQKGPQRIASASTLAAAGVVGREHLRFYRFEQLSNHALADGGKCRCGCRGAKGCRAGARNVPLAGE